MNFYNIVNGYGQFNALVIVMLSYFLWTTIVDGDNYYAITQLFLILINVGCIIWVLKNRLKQQPTTTVSGVRKP